MIVEVFGGAVCSLWLDKDGPGALFQGRKGTFIDQESELEGKNRVTG